MSVGNYANVVGAIITFMVINIYGTEITIPSRPSGPVADFANVIDNTTELKINSLARKLWVAADFGLLLVTLDSIGNVPADSFTRQLCRDWKVWTKNNPEGVLILCVLNPPRMIIEPAKGSIGYLKTGALSAALGGIEVQTMPAPDSVSGKLLDIVAAVATQVTGYKRIPTEELPVFAAAKGRETMGLGDLVKRFYGIMLFGFGMIIFFMVKLLRSKFKRITRRRNCREPFGNVLSGDGFGGGCLPGRWKI